MGMQNKRILVVEDEAPIRDMLRFALERAEFRISLAGDVPEARLRIAESRPDLILLDWMMPGVSGIEFTRELKGAPMTKDIPIIMVTARAEEEDTVRGLNVGCDDYVSKPFSFPELTARIQAVLRRTLPGGEEEQLAGGGRRAPGGCCAALGGAAKKSSGPWPAGRWTPPASASPPRASRCAWVRP